MKIALAIAVAAFVAVGCSSAAPRPSSTGAIATAAASGAPSQRAAPSSSASFTSKLYRYQLVLPSAWLAHPAESTWKSGVLEGTCPSDWDCFSDNRDGVTLAAAAMALPADLTVNQWRLRIHASTPEVCSDSEPRTDTTLDSEPAQAWSSSCSSEDLDVIKIVAIHSGWGYIVLFASPTSVGVQADHATLDSIVDTFRFATF